MSSAAPSAEESYFFNSSFIARGGASASATVGGAAAPPATAGDIPECALKIGGPSLAEEGGFGEDHVEQQPDEVYGRRKKRRADETSIASVIENNGRALESALVRVAQAQIDAYNRNSELDRIQRQSISDSLVGVLEKLADSLTRVAERL